jgi:TolB-like protein/class 3 adenylate cyclase
MATEGFKRKLTAILSADVVGYSRLMGNDEETTIRTLNDYRTAISNLVKHHRGRVVDTTGDNLMAEFASAVDAVKCSVEIQRDLAERNTQLRYDRRMEFRIGVNVGDVVEEEKRIYGDGVNIAARVETLADAGGICISGRVYDQVENKFDFKYEFLGEKEVKNIARPIRVYRVLSYPGAAAYRVLEAKKAAGKIWRNIFISVVCILLGGALIAAIWYFYLIPPPTLTEIATEQTPKLDLPDLPSIAVLPFVNVGGEAEQEYFSDGMTDDLITDLSKISGLFVIARNSVFTYKGKPVIVQQVAKELGVRYVLEGSVRRAENKLRINAQLIDATTGHHLWADRYDGLVGDVFALQDMITEKIVAVLAVKLTSVEQEQIAHKYTDNLTAYDAFLQGRAHYFRCTPSEYAKAVSYFKKAVELDPNYGQAYAALALTYWESSLNFWTFYLGVAWWEARNLSEGYLQMAMLNPSPLAHQAASKMLIDQHEHKNAIAEAQRAIVLDPNDANSYLAMAYALIYSGKPKEAFGFVEKAVRLNPHYPAYYLFVLGLAHFTMERFEEATVLYERALKRNPENYVPMIPLAAAHAHLGHRQEAVATIEKLQKALPIIFTLSTLKKSSLWSYKNSADQDRLLYGLRKAGMLETPYDAIRRTD